jgi:phosphoribosylanthranilate isomerase
MEKALERASQMALSIKICGLKTPQALDVALDSGADLVGFVFFAPSPRHLGLEAARMLGQRVQGRAGKVALTVDANDDTLLDVIAALKPNMLQLHGSETPDRVVAVRTRFGLPVMKALPIAERKDLSPIREYAQFVDRLIFDARAPREATRPGGLGKPFDWTLLKDIRAGVPFMLSGGLDAANVSDALRITRAPGVDVSSGVERAPGEKDPDKIRAFIRAARAAETELSSPPLQLGEASIVRSVK